MTIRQKRVRSPYAYAAVKGRIFRPPHAVNLRLTLGPLRRGHCDPTMRVGPDGIWRATRTPEGPASTHIVSTGDQVLMEAWGPGADWALEAAPALVGALDDDAGFEPGHPVVEDLHRRLRGLRICRSQAVTEAVVPTILEQKVIGVQAHRSYAAVVRRFGEEAPGPGGLLLPPLPHVLASVPYHSFHRLGVERKRADTIRRACSYARRLEETVGMTPAEARSRLTALPGLGPWSAAEVAFVALGDPDAVSLGDYHLPHLVSYALTGEPRGDDARMLELLEPWRGQRGRVIKLLEAGADAPPRYGPRMPLQHIAGF
jgi:3-methyladenine DNA glycosylase/8-oxoguanine DNA glycosylase